MTQNFKRKKFPLSNNVFAKRLSRMVLIGLIIAMIPIFTTLVLKHQHFGSFTGVVESESETVGSIDSSRIISIEVYPGQVVKPDDVLVRLEPTDRVMDLAMNEARLMDYEQSLLRYQQTQAQYAQSLQESARKYRQLLAEASVELEKEKMNQVRDEAELKGLQAEIKRLQPLVEKRIVSEIELTGLRPKIAALELTLPHYKPLTDALQRQLDQTSSALLEVQELYASLNQSNGSSSFEQALKKARDSCISQAIIEPSVLRATREGVVSRIQHQAGDIVAAGDPIIRIASKSSLYIIGMLPQSNPRELAIGEKIVITRMSEQAQRVALTAEVESLEPEVMDLIDPFNPAPRVSVRGRRVRLRIINQDHHLVPGETVYLQPAQSESLVDSIKRCFFPGSGFKQLDVSAIVKP
ncbi:MAG: HlyD family efflux transporter periplasmic adaptor subunit [Kiritimatiellae bacterium]|nr:HlyD family efflux transporter periplasmic adaptor subunit [Kiritimatiellia bacterium]